MAQKKYQHLVLGGSFDLLHLGHKHFLKKAFKISNFVSIGITSDNYNRSVGKITFENESQRLKNLKQFLTQEDLIQKANIIFINDVYGNTLQVPNIDAILVTQDSRKGADLINSKRLKNGLSKIQVVICDFVLDENKKIISSTRIRDGEIDITGSYYKNKLLKIAGKKFPDNLRQDLKKPYGDLISISSLASLTRPIISVGDISTLNLSQENIPMKLSIIDFKVQRKEKFFDLSDFGFKKISQIYEVTNEPGQISKDLIETVEKALKSRESNQIILVRGEEDLSFIPVALLAPLGTTCIYGQPNFGAIKVVIDYQTKERVLKLLELIT